MTTFRVCRNHRCILASWIVREELSRQDDDLWTFAKNFSTLFVKPGDGEEVRIKRLLSNPDFNAKGGEQVPAIKRILLLSR